MLTTSTDIKLHKSKSDRSKLRLASMVDHAMVCPFGGFPTIRHNKVRDLTASLLTEVSYNVQTEPSLQPVTTETFSLASANTTNDARLDIKTRGFWRHIF